MANVIVQRTLFGSGSSRKVVRSVHIISDGSEETDLIVYDNSDFINDATKGRLTKIIASGNPCTCRLEWDQTTDNAIISFDPSYPLQVDFSFFGGISNPNGAGATGDILFSTGSLDLGDEITLIFEIEQD
jgi:hypothetical protein